LIDANGIRAEGDRRVVKTESSKGGSKVLYDLQETMIALNFHGWPLAAPAVRDGFVLRVIVDRYIVEATADRIYGFARKEMHDPDYSRVDATAQDPIVLEWSSRVYYYDCSSIRVAHPRLERLLLLLLLLFVGGARIYVQITHQLAAKPLEQFVGYLGVVPQWTVRETFGKRDIGEVTRPPTYHPQNLPQLGYGKSREIILSIGYLDPYLRGALDGYPSEADFLR
jgi:hypothetical protein